MTTLWEQSEVLLSQSVMLVKQKTAETAKSLE